MRRLIKKLTAIEAIILTVSAIMVLLVAAGIVAAIFPTINYLDSFRLIVLLLLPLLIWDTWQRIFLRLGRRHIEDVKRDILKDLPPAKGPITSIEEEVEP